MRKIHEKFLRKILRNKKHQAKVLPKKFHLNGNITGFRPQFQKLELKIHPAISRSRIERANNSQVHQNTSINTTNAFTTS